MYVHGPAEKDTSKMKYEQPQPQGSQNDIFSLQWCGVANTEWGQIPGKVHVTLGRDTCYFAHGSEKPSKDYRVIRSQTFSKKPDDSPQGRRKDGTPLWCAVARSRFGTVCGWADA
jgi:hypothetical protein